MFVSLFLGFSISFISHVNVLCSVFFCLYVGGGGGDTCIAKKKEKKKKKNDNTIVREGNHPVGTVKINDICKLL